MRQMQQGDVLLQEIAAMPTGGRAHSRTLAEGEATGHHHTLVETEGLEVREVDGALYARIVEPTDLTHQEHHTITLPPGVWRVGQVREYDHLAEEARQVVD